MSICKLETRAATTKTQSVNAISNANRPLAPVRFTNSVEIRRHWSLKLAIELPEETETTRQSIVQWLMGPNPESFDAVTDDRQRLLITQALNYRYQVLRQRYWQIAPDQAYHTLIQHLCKLCLSRNKVRIWIACSRDRYRTVTDLLQEVIQDMLQRDRYLKDQIRWIGECSPRSQVRNVLMLATIEEYCLRPVQNQLLLVHRCTSYLQRTQRQGMTNLPSKQRVRFISEDIRPSESDAPMSLLDVEAVAQYQVQAQAQEQQQLRKQIKQDFLAYLEVTLGETAACWLDLHLKGFTQAEITHEIPLSRLEAYRLKDKIRHHAMQVFAPKEQPELVLSWLNLDPKEDHSAGSCDRPKRDQAQVVISR